MSGQSLIVELGDEFDECLDLRAFVLNRMDEALERGFENYLLYGNDGKPYPRFNHMLDQIHELT